MPLALAFVMLVPISLHTVAGASKAMVKRAMAEVDAIWRDVGVKFEWHTDDDVPLSLHVEVGDAIGRGLAGARELPLAWIDFVDGVPKDQIYVSVANARVLLDASASIDRRVDLPVAAVNEYLGRALGRSLAHEIGHYLFRSAVHDSKGVMATRRPTNELFGPDRGAFRLTSLQRDRLAIVLERYRVAKRAPAPVQ
jgi:hypothetical protein